MHVDNDSGSPTDPVIDFDSDLSSSIAEDSDHVVGAAMDSDRDSDLLLLCYEVKMNASGWTFCSI